jgi:hypothetical protein
MINFYLKLIGILIFPILSTAQSITPQSVNSSGTKMIQSNGSLSFTVGELVVLSHTDINGYTLGGGFTAGATVSTANIKQTDSAIMDVIVYPNPTSEFVYIQINHSTLHQFVVTITDLQGKEIYFGKYNGIANVIGINTEAYVAGTYILNLKNLDSQVLGTYKIIKY